jgi:hypothetical protein
MQGDLVFCQKKNDSYFPGQLKFFNSRRKEGVIGEILAFLTIKEKFLSMNVCRNIFVGVKRQLDFNV